MARKINVQSTIWTKFNKFIEETKEPFGFADHKRLTTLLSQVNHDSLWGLAIRNVFNYKGDIEQLIDDLSSQCIDDPFTMMAICGQEIVKLLLRYKSSRP